MINLRNATTTTTIVALCLVSAMMLMTTHYFLLDSSQRQVVSNLHTRSQEWQVPTTTSSRKNWHNNNNNLTQEQQQFRRRLQLQELAREQMQIETTKQLFEQDYPPTNIARMKRRVDQFRVYDPPTQLHMPYDIENCPFDPPEDYPIAWNLLQVLDNWNPENTDIPPFIYNGLCMFDWDTDQEKITNYRQLELPFVFRNHPQVLQTAERWNTPNYLEDLLGNQPIMTEASISHRFLYSRPKKQSQQEYLPEGWTKPTEDILKTYGEWKEYAQQLQESKEDHTTQQHWYFRLIGDYASNTFLYDELEFFNPLRQGFMHVEPKNHRGINCRFGMKGNMAEAHFDRSRNFIALMGGQRRYILANPQECLNLELYPWGHPSQRHSSANWGTINDEIRNYGGDNDRPIAHARVNEVVMQAGDVLYLPTDWFHFIVSLNLNFQCNARSGTETTWNPVLEECGQI